VGAHCVTILFNNLEHGFLIADAAGTVFNPAVDQVLSLVTPAGKLLGGNILNGYTGASIQMHMAGFAPNWCTRDFLWVAFDYPFNQLDCTTVFGQVPETNKRALEIDLKLGFKIVARIEGVFPDGACIVLALAREDCRWLKLKPRMIKAGSE
jgi:hypothetical protein